MENQISMVRNFSRSIVFRFAMAEPMVNTTMDESINSRWMML